MTRRRFLTIFLVPLEPTIAAISARISHKETFEQTLNDAIASALKRRPLVGLVGPVGAPGVRAEMGRGAFTGGDDIRAVLDRLTTKWAGRSVVVSREEKVRDRQLDEIRALLDEILRRLGGDWRTDIGDRFLRRSEVQYTTGLSRSTIYALIEQNKFPKPVPLNERGVAWLKSEIEEWKRARIAARDQKTK